MAAMSTVNEGSLRLLPLSMARPEIYPKLSRYGTRRPQAGDTNAVAFASAASAAEVAATSAADTARVNCAADEVGWRNSRKRVESDSFKSAQGFLMHSTLVFRTST